MTQGKAETKPTTQMQNKKDKTIEKEKEINLLISIIYRESKFIIYYLTSCISGTVHATKIMTMKVKFITFA